MKLTACLLASLVLTAPARAAETLPNFVVLFADDLGYGDLGCYGHPTIRTPNLDRMAAEGMRFTQFYCAAPVCTPSRAALMTGRLPIRSGMCSNARAVLFPDSAGGLPAEEITLAEALKAKKYATACVGKWHLGCLPQYLPTRNGFDYYFGIPYSNDMINRPTRGVPLLRNEEIIEDPAVIETLTPRYTEEATKFIRQNRDRPFFLYMPYTFPHVPLAASDAFKGKSPRGLYGDVVEELDGSVGQVLNTLRELDLAKRTFVFFASDNGPWLVKKTNGGSAGLLREGKGTTWDGGMRVPGIAWWPGQIKPGTVSLELGSTLDLLPTCLALAGIAAPSDRPLDGYDITPALLGTGPSPRKQMIFYNGTSLFAWRRDRYKLHLSTSQYSQKGVERHDTPLLFDLLADPSEKHNIASDHPDVVADILKDIEAHKASFTPAPDQLALRVETQPAR
jgi:arylsulfatase A-like enzyme